jgi:hypothetical protein
MEALNLLFIFSFQLEALSYAIAPAAFFPPHSGIFRAVQHLRQFFLDLGQAVGAHFHRRLINLTIRGFERGSLVHIPQIRDFLTKAGEMFQNVWHVLMIPQISHATVFIPAPGFASGRGLRVLQFACGSASGLYLACAESLWILTKRYFHQRSQRYRPEPKARVAKTR